MACEASKIFGVDIELYGFDIQPSHFPTTSCTPSNVHFVLQDILKDEFAAELIESFDLVHVRAFSSLIKNDDASPLCQVALKLLKPGGFFQWEEPDMANVSAVIDGEPAPQSTKLMHLLRAGGQATGLTFG